MLTTDRIKGIIAKADRFKELILVPPLSIIIFRIFFSQRRASVFDVVALGTLLLWRFVVRDKPLRPLPKPLVVAVCLYILSDFAGALFSNDQLWELAELRKYVNVFIGALLFTLPLEEKTRKILITLFLLAAAISGGEGIWQYFKTGLRSQGSFPHAILYAETLALAWGASLFLVIFSIRRTNGLNTDFFVYSLIVLLTLGGILFSEARGIWIGLLIAITASLFLFDRRKSLIFLCCFVMMLSVPFACDKNLRERAKSIITSAYTENTTGSTGTRMELWKGALMIFREHPIFGAGSGNFESNIKKLVDEKKLNAMLSMVHAHNVYLQSLATRGIVGFAVLVFLFTALMAWGIGEIKLEGGIGGYIIIFCTVLTMAGGVTEDNLGTTKYLSALYFTMGLLGPMGVSQKE